MGGGNPRRRRCNRAPSSGGGATDRPSRASAPAWCFAARHRHPHLAGVPMRLALSVVLTLVLAPAAAAQVPGRGPDSIIDASMRAEVIDGVLRRLDEGYVVPEKAAEMAQAVRARARQGAYDRLVSAQAFADTLT